VYGVLISSHAVLKFAAAAVFALTWLGSEGAAEVPEPVHVTGGGGNECHRRNRV
jgi:hypothetical protein